MSSRWSLPIAFLVASAGLAGCATSSLPRTTASAGPETSTPRRSFEWCAELRLTASGSRCIRPLSAAEQAHRGVSLRLERVGGQAVGYERLNGRGFPEPDDDGCSTYRYRFEAGYVVEGTGYRPDGSVCDRTLYSQRAERALFVDAWGRPKFARDRLHTAALFERNARGDVVSMRPLASDGSPAQLQAAYELRNERDAQGLVLETCYFDAQGKPTQNNYGVHCWKYRHDEFGNDVEQTAWDSEGRPATAARGAHRYVYAFDRYGNLTRQTSLGTDDKPLSTEQSWCPVLAYHRDAFGSLVGKDCLDGEGKPNQFDEGNAIWRGTPDARGQTREVRYFDQRGNPFESSVGFARVELDHDDFGHVTERRFFRSDGSPGQADGPAVVRYVWGPQQLEIKRENLAAGRSPTSSRGCWSSSFEYDQYRQVVRQSCLGYDGKPTASYENVATTLSRYDARGLLVETNFVDAAGKPVDAKRGFSRRLFRYDASGVDSKTQHFKTDGSAVNFPRFSVLWVRAPDGDGFWPAPSRARALAQIEEARRQVGAGLPWPAALQRFGDDKVYAVNPGDNGYLNLDTAFQVAKATLASLAVGEYSRVIELPYGFALYRRTE